MSISVLNIAPMICSCDLAKFRFVKLKFIFIMKYKVAAEFCLIADIFELKPVSNENTNIRQISERPRNRAGRNS